jgi:DNA-binding NtrC family response regulator
LAEVEFQQIVATLQRHQGNKTAAAAELGISRRTLHYRLAEYRQRGTPIDDYLL